MNVKNKTANSYNKSWYDSFWKNYKIPQASFWPHWKIIKPLLKKSALEIGPGTKPKIPVKGNYFVEISHEAAKKLEYLQGKTFETNLTNKLPFPSEKFDLVCAFEVLEHIPNDAFVLCEINRVIKKNGTFLVSFPLNMRFWNKYDWTVGHVRRYNPQTIESTFYSCGFKIVKYAAMDINWPGKISGYLLSFFAKNFPQIFANIGASLDMKLNSSIKAPIHLNNWNKNSYKGLNSTTGFFVLKKIL